MLRVALKGLATRKLRASLTGLAIVLGVAMISGTYVLTDTINNGFNTIFDTSYKNADAVISAKTSGMLATILVLMIVARTPDEIPLLELGTDPITELALGLRKSPIPNPTTASQSAI